MRVLAKPEVIEYLDNLVDILFEKQYFSYVEDAIDYVNELCYDVKTNLPTKLHKPAPNYYAKYGKNMYYAVFKKNKRTTWYAFFSKYAENGETVYLLCYIGNNHTEAHHL